MNKRIIVVEDDQDIREMVEFILAEADFEVSDYDRVAKFWVGLRTGAVLGKIEFGLEQGDEHGDTQLPVGILPHRQLPHRGSGLPADGVVLAAAGRRLPGDVCCGGI